MSTNQSIRSLFATIAVVTVASTPACRPTAEEAAAISPLVPAEAGTTPEESASSATSAPHAADEARAEVEVNLRRMADGATSYFSTEHADYMGNLRPAQFPEATAPSPGFDALQTACVSGEGLIDASSAFWQAPTWSALQFFVDRPHRAVYAFSSEGEGPNATFSAIAYADPDCDGERTEYRLEGRVENMEVYQSRLTVR